MNGLEWLNGLIGSVRCANCHAAYERTDVNVIGNREDYWFVRCTCHACGTQGVGAVIVREVNVASGSPDAVPAEPVIGTDDVLSAHDILRGYAGGVQGLFSDDR